MWPPELPDVLTLWRAVSVVVPIWLAVSFGRTLRAGNVPLIERIARVSASALPPALCRHTRRLTAVWCAYFAFAALLPLTVSLPFGGISTFVWSGMAVLFVGEHRLRTHLFPGHDFPGLMQQLRDTWSVWRLGF